MRECWVDGRIVTGVDALPWSEQGLVHGAGLLETIAVHGGRLPLWQRHVDRLVRSARELGLSIDLPAGLHDVALEACARAGSDAGALRIVATAGGHLCLAVRDGAPKPRAGHEVRLHVPSLRRGLGDPTAAHKTTSRLLLVLAQQQARAAGADEALMLGPASSVLETVWGNLFARIGGELCTPAPNGAFLPGIARALLIEQLAKGGRAVVVRAITLDELRGADALWVTNAVAGPRPARLGEHPVARRIGPDPLADAWRAALDA